MWHNHDYSESPDEKQCDTNETAAEPLMKDDATQLWPQRNPRWKTMRHNCDRSGTPDGRRCDTTVTTAEPLMKTMRHNCDHSGTPDDRPHSRETTALSRKLPWNGSTWINSSPTTSPLLRRTFGWFSVWLWSPVPLYCCLMLTHSHPEHTNHQFYLSNSLYMATLWRLPCLMLTHFHPEHTNHQFYFVKLPVHGHYVEATLSDVDPLSS